MAEIASTQVRTLETQHIAREKEYQSLRQQLLDFQVQSDEKTIIGSSTLTFFKNFFATCHFLKKIEFRK